MQIRKECHNANSVKYAKNQAFIDNLVFVTLFQLGLSRISLHEISVESMAEN